MLISNSRNNYKFTILIHLIFICQNVVSKRTSLLFLRLSASLSNPLCNPRLSCVSLPCYLGQQRRVGNCQRTNQGTQ